MTAKKDPDQEPSIVAWVNWEGIARFLGYPVEDIDRVRRMRLVPTVSATLASSKR